MKSDLPLRTRSLDTINATVACVLANLAIVGVALVARMTFVSLLALLVLVGIAAFRPAASVAAIPAVIGFVYEQMYLGNARFNPQEVMLVTTVAGAGLNLVWSFSRTRSIRTIRLFFAKVRVTLHVFDATAVALVVIGAVSLVTVALPAYRHESLRVFRWVILEPVIYYVLARWYLQDRGVRQLAIFSFAAGAVVVAIIGLIDSLSGHGLAVEGVTRISGVYPQPNALALYLERPFVLIVGIATVYRRDLAWRWLALACVMGATLILTFSRGAVLAAGLAIIVILVIGQRRRLAVIASVLGVALIAGLALTASARIDNLFSGGSGSLRLSLWHSAIEMIRDHPIFGIGLDQFLYVYAPRYIKPQAWSERFTSHPHDIVLDTWLSLGIMGIVLALVFLGILAWSTVRLARYRNGLGVAAVGVMFVGIMHGLVDNGYFLPDLALIFWFMTAIIASETLDSVRFGQQET
ncbi:MAG TPA: O-antigen ligase family protein [Nitrolancea sp.]|nr:O-antigen ligase family protein [Nitrolancea sp.]